MISTVTTTTVSSITSTVAAISIGASLALVTIVTLFALLIPKELSVSTSHPRVKALGLAVDVVLLPLLMAFAMIAVTRVAQILF